MRWRCTRLAAAALAPLLLAAAPFGRTEEREPCRDHDPLKKPHFGDTHVHTTFSFDAYGQGTRNTPRDAYRFARGEALGIQPYDADGRALRRVQLDRPLDFTVVTDHAEMLGETHLCRTEGSAGYGSLMCTVARRWPLLGYVLINSQSMNETDPKRYGFCGDDGRVCLEAAREPWRATQAAAEEAYDRSAACRFTSFVGYEWSGTRDAGMIHRNVVFRNERVPAQPASYLETRSAPALWRSLRENCLERADGCDVLAIPHNSNLSAGWLFRTTGEDGAPLTRDEARARSAIETLVEVTQHKGDSECRAGGETPDELCGFETLAFAKMRESATPWSQTPPAPLSYVREVLTEGLVQHAAIGANPFRLGLIGSTDTHLATPGLVSEERFVGHAAGRTSLRLEVHAVPDDVRLNPGGLAVLWAEENSRDALFQAMRRRETYGTSGPRMVVRFFGGWQLPADLCERDDFAAAGYASGVPMGGELAPRTAAAPALAVSALRDAGTATRPGTALQRIQIVKSWVEDGVGRERVHEVAGDPDNGAGVDPATCEARGVGFDSLCAVWRDPDFRPGQHALYYARVVENPSCRWTRWTCNAHGADCGGDVPDELAACCDPGVPMTVQDRAWTSPIWYTPDP